MNKEIHYRYVILILAMIVVSLITFRYTADAALRDYLSVGATISSLILAILAIIQGFISSSSLNDSVLILNNSSRDISEKSVEITTLIDGLKKEIIELAELKRIPSMITNLSEQFSFQGLTGAVPPETKDDSKVSKSIIQVDESFRDKFIEGGSARNLINFYIISKAFEKHKKFKVTDVINFKIEDSNTIIYLSNFMTFMDMFKTLGLVKYSLNEVEFDITELNQNFRSLNPKILKRLEELKAKEFKNKEIYEAFKADISKTDEYFSS